MCNKSKDILNKPNELMSLNSTVGLSLTQRKAYNCFLKMAQNKIKFEGYNNNIFQISCDELHTKSNLGNKNFDYIYNDLKNLMSTVVEIIDKDNPKNWEAFTLLSHIKRENNIYYYELNQFILKALRDQTFFTPLNLLIINSLSSQYSIIFYELAIRYNKFKIPKMTIEEVRKLTNTEDDYNRIYDFKKYVLDTACEEISEKTDIILTYETEKKGRRIAFIDFEIKIKPNGFDAVADELEQEEDTLKNIPETPALSFDTDLEEVLCCIPDYFFMKLKKPKLNLIKNIEKYLDEYDKGYIKHYINYCKKNKDTIRYYDSYLISAIDNNYEEIENKKQKEKELEKKRIKEEFENLSEEEHNKITLSFYNTLSNEEKDHIKNTIKNVEFFKLLEKEDAIITFITSSWKDRLIKFYLGE